MRALKRLLLGMLLLLLVMAAVAYTLPGTLLVQRSIVINAPEQDIFPYLNDFRKINEWSPWPQEIVESEPGKLVVVNIEFDEGAPASARYELTPAGAGARVTWRLTAEAGNNPLERWMGLLLDRRVGEDFQLGLARLKELVEKGNAPS